MNLQNEITEWQRRNFPPRLGDTDSTRQAVSALIVCEEAGELARVVAKTIQNIRPETRGKVEEEIADVIIASYSLASELNLDLDVCVNNRWNVIRQRVWSETHDSNR